VLGLGLAGLALWLVAGQRDELSGASADLAHLRWWWLAVAVVAEVASYGAFARMQWLLLRSGGVRASAPRILGMSLASNAMQNSLPAGAAFAAAFVFRQYRRLGADEVLAGWALVAGVALSFMTISALAGVGLVVAFGTGSALDLVQAISGTVAFAALLLLGWTRRSWILRQGVPLLRLSKRLLGRPRGDVEGLVASVRDRLAAVTPSLGVWAGAAIGAAGNWLLDLGCLGAAFVAVGAAPPWRGLLLAYAAGQLAALLPITPGGLGVVEGSLTVALVAFGGAEASSVAAVLVYRLISFWGELPVGWLATAAITRASASDPHSHRVPARAGAARARSEAEAATVAPDEVPAAELLAEPEGA
jgi:uncharacterized membrane protein YbhN (UPF0104 family)